MIKFLRNIRFNLLSGNSKGKYVKYAIGEIILVVIGILIALQINNWNESKKQTEYQKAQLSNLRSEINSMKAFIKTQIGYFELAKVGNSAFLNFMESKNTGMIASDSLNKLIFSALNTDLVTGQRLSFETKVDFKSLPDFKYDEIEEALQDWRHFAEKIGSDFQLIENNREDDLQRAMINAGAPGWQVLFRNYNPPNFPIDYKALIQSIEIYAVLYYRLKRMEAIVGDLNRGVEELDAMLFMIDSYLDVNM